MKKKLSLLFISSVLSISSLCIVQAAPDSFQPYNNEKNDLVMPKGGYNGHILENENVVLPRITSNNLFSISYSIRNGGSINSFGSDGKYLVASDISNDVLEISSDPSSSNRSGNMEVGLAYYNAATDDVHAPYDLLVDFPTNSHDTQNIYSPNLSSKKYYGVVNNKSSNEINGYIYYNDLQ